MIQKKTNLSFVRPLSKTIMELENKKKEFLKILTITIEQQKLRAFLSQQISRTLSEMIEKMMKKLLISLIHFSYSPAFLIYITVLWLNHLKTRNLNLILHLTVNQKVATVILKMLSISFASQKFMMVRKQNKLNKG